MGFIIEQIIIKIRIPYGEFRDIIEDLVNYSYPYFNVKPMKRK